MPDTDAGTDSDCDILDFVIIVHVIEINSDSDVVFVVLYIQKNYFDMSRNGSPGV